MKESAEQRQDARIGPERTLSDLVEELGDPLETAAGHPPVALDTVLATVGDPGRRYVLTYLLLIDRPVSTAELVDYVAGQTDLDAESDRLRRDIAAELVEEQLPVLESAGFVEYNRERQMIGETDRTQVALPFLHLCREYVRRQSGDDYE